MIYLALICNALLAGILIAANVSYGKKHPLTCRARALYRDEDDIEERIT